MKSIKITSIFTFMVVLSLSLSANQDDVNPCGNDSNALLESIYFPGLEIWENPETYMITDTLINFHPKQYHYEITLPNDIETSPALVAKAQSNYATVSVVSASTIFGTEEERTTTVTITAEDGTTKIEYTLTFSVEQPGTERKGSLFISEIAYGWGAEGHYNLQIYNPSDRMVDLTDYAIVSYPELGWNGLLNMYKKDSNWIDNNAYIMRFGSIVEPNDQGVPVYKTDLYCAPTLIEAQGTKPLVTKGAYPIVDGSLEEQANIRFVVGPEGPQENRNEWLQSWIDYSNMVYGTQNLYGSGSLLLNHFNPKPTGSDRTLFGLAKIVNDSVKDGLKHVLSDFENDYEWVDVFGGVSMIGEPLVLYDADTAIDLSIIKGPFTLVRKPAVYKGCSIDKYSFGRKPNDIWSSPPYYSQWDVYGVDSSGNPVPDEDPSSVKSIRSELFNHHTMVSFAHIPYVRSNIYFIDNDKIYGVEAGTSVNVFMSKLILPDSDMNIKVFNSDSVQIFYEQIITEGTFIKTLSASGDHDFTYHIPTLGPLSTDCDLTSEIYTITSKGDSGTISDIRFGRSMHDVLSKLIIPEFATVQVTNGSGEIIPLYKYNCDTLAIQSLIMTATLAKPGVFVEVVAQNGIDVKVYSLEFNDEEEPFVLSDEYVVDQDSKLILFIDTVTIAQFLSNLIPSPGAEVKVVTQHYFTKTRCYIGPCDKVLVTKGDTEIEYWLLFSGYGWRATWDGPGGEGGLIGNFPDCINTYLEKQNSTKEISIFPNPVQNSLNFNSIEQASLIIVRNLTGKPVLQTQVSIDRPQLEMEALPSGIYLVSVVQKGDIFNFKVVKK